MAGIDDIIDAELDKAIVQHPDLIETIELLKKYKKIGISADQVHAFLNEKLKEHPERDDYIRDVMDIVVGHCRPDIRIWD